MDFAMGQKTSRALINIYNMTHVLSELILNPVCPSKGPLSFHPRQDDLLHLEGLIMKDSVSVTVHSAVMKISGENNQSNMVDL